MTCKNCAYHMVCCKKVYTPDNGCECKNFKDKSAIPPISVGDTIYYLQTKYFANWEYNQFMEIGKEIVEGTVSMLQQKANKNWKFRFTYITPASKHKSSFDVNADNIGKTFFLNKEEAEQKLRELNKNEQL